jgi:sporulation protein YlmC with PRC-barrel domain
MKQVAAFFTAGILCCSIVSIASAQANAQSNTQSKAQSNTQQPAAGQSNAHIAGASPLGIEVTAMNAVMLGWSAKKAILGKTVLNDQKQKIGKIDDIIVTPNDSVSFAIIGTGGFLGVGKHDVAIPMNQIKSENNNFVLPGATKQALKALPAFEYNKGK